MKPLTLLLCNDRSDIINLAKINVDDNFDIDHLDSLNAHISQATKIIHVGKRIMLDNQEYIKIYTPLVKLYLEKCHIKGVLSIDWVQIVIKEAAIVFAGHPLKTHTYFTGPLWISDS